MKVIVLLVLMIVWVLLVYAWELWCTRRIQREWQGYRDETHEIFDDLRRCVEGQYERRKKRRWR